MDLPDAEREQYEKQLENTDAKTLLIQQNAYLDAILQALTDHSESETVRMFECDMCNDEIPENELENHMMDEHGAHGSMDIQSMYTEV